MDNKLFFRCCNMALKNKDKTFTQLDSFLKYIKPTEETEYRTTGDLPIRKALHTLFAIEKKYKYLTDATKKEIKSRG